MEKENITKLDWVNIISNIEFQNYLNFDLIKEISMLSKIVRVKFSSKLFYSIKFKQDYKNINGESVAYYNVHGLSELDNLIRSDGNEFQKSFDVEKILSNINSEFVNISRFVSKLCLHELNHVGYFLFPLLQNFVQLKLLRLNKCKIPYSSFLNLGVSFPNLIGIGLHHLILIKLPTDIKNSVDFISPPNLATLRVTKITVSERKSIFNPSDLLFNEIFDKHSHIFGLPRISIPSLKNLAFIDRYEEKCDLDEFLELNPNLESLKVKSFYISKLYKFKSLKSLELSYAVCFNFDEKFINQEGIKELTIFIEDVFYFKYVTKLCSVCPNLEKLRFSIPFSNNPQQSFDNFLIPVLSKLPKAKTLIMRIGNYKTHILDISEFPYIENLVLEIKVLDILNIKFDNCVSLKSIEINFIWVKLDNEVLQCELSKMRGTYSNWDFKLVKGKIIGYRNSNKLL